MLWVTIGMAITLLGLALVVFGCVGRVVGDEPFCRRCRHNLTGLTSNQCPECGDAITIESLRWGLRRKRPIPIVTGLFLTCTVLTVVGLYLAKVSAVTNWYTWAPVWMLLDMGERKDVLAIRELVARFDKDQVKGDALTSAIGVALGQHENVPEDGLACEWADLLAAYDLSIGLNEAQQDQVYSHIIRSMRLVSRQVVCEGDPAITEVKAITRGSRRFQDLMRWRYEVHGATHYPGAPNHWFQVGFYNRGKESTMLTSSRGQWKKPGSIEETWTITTAMFNRASDPDKDKPLWLQSFDIGTRYEIVGKASDPISLVQRELNPKLALSRISRQDNDLSVYVELDSVHDICLGFEVVGRIGALELPLGCVAWEVGQSGEEYVYDFCTDYVPPDERASLPVDAEEIEIILLPSRNAAARTLTCYEVLDKEFNLGTFPIPKEDETYQPKKAPSMRFDDLLDDLDGVEGDPE